MSGFRDWYNDVQYSESDSVGSCYPSIVLASLHIPTTGEEATGRFWQRPGYGPGSDSVELYRPQPDYENRHPEVDSAGSNDYMDYYKGYADSGEMEEHSHVILRSGFKSDHEEDPSMEMEEVLHREPPSYSDTAESETDEPPAPKTPPEDPPRACCSGASKLPRVTCKEAASSSDTPPPKTNSPRAHAPKPRRGKKAVAPVPAPEMHKTAAVLPDTHAQKPEQALIPKPAKDNLLV